MQEPITIVRDLPGGHITIRAESVPAAVSLYRELLAFAPEFAAPVGGPVAAPPLPEEPSEQGPPSISQVRKELAEAAEQGKQRTRRAVNGAATVGVAEGTCPQHGRVSHGKWGPYCPELVNPEAEGPARFCKWRPQPRKAAAS